MNPELQAVFDKIFRELNKSVVAQFGICTLSTAITRYIKALSSFSACKYDKLTASQVEEYISASTERNIAVQKLSSSDQTTFFKLYSKVLKNYGIELTSELKNDMLNTGKPVT